MRVALFGAAVAAMGLLGACDAWETATPPAPPPAAPLEAAAPPSFEDGGCLAYLLLRRAAISAGRAQGDAAALDAAIAAWRARGAQEMTSEELAQYEVSSMATRDDESADAIAARATECVASAPRQSPQTPPGETPGAPQ